MGFSIIPKGVGGVSVNSALGPLAALFRNDKIDNLIFPSDLGSNPAMGHAVIFQAYDRTTQLAQQAGQIGQVFGTTVSNLKSSTDVLSAANNFKNVVTGTATEVLKTAGNLFTAPSYKESKVGSPLTSISLFMPESINVNYNSSYNEISMTETLGIPGIIGNAVSDMYNFGLKNMVTPYAIGAFGEAARRLVGNPNVGSAITQALGVVTNPQTQLIYHGVDLRQFQLEFILTPKSANEAEKVKQICDSFAFYSLPNIAGGQIGSSGQYLNPPQLFSVQFRFLGANDIVGNVSNVISSALTNSGLGFLTNETRISNGTASKFFTVNDCVLENVSIDYTPNGFATYNDGYPVQTRISLSFKETQMITKEHFVGSAIYDNYSSKTTENLNVKNFNDLMNSGGL